MRQLNGTAAAVLGYLTLGPQSGYDIVKGLDEMVGAFWNVTTSQIYRELQGLANAGLVEAGPREARDRRPYTLTDPGRAALQAWMSEPADEDVVRIPLLLKLCVLFSFANPQPAWLGELVASYRATHAAKLADYEAKLAQFDAAQAPYAHLVRYGVFYERAVLDWVDSLPWRRP